MDYFESFTKISEIYDGNEGNNLSIYLSFFLKKNNLNNFNRLHDKNQQQIYKFVQIIPRQIQYNS